MSDRIVYDADRAKFDIPCKHAMAKWAVKFGLIVRYNGIPDTRDEDMELVKIDKETGAETVYPCEFEVPYPKRFNRLVKGPNDFENNSLIANKKAITSQRIKIYAQIDSEGLDLQSPEKSEVKRVIITTKFYDAPKVKEDKCNNGHIQEFYHCPWSKSQLYEGTKRVEWQK